jgi:glycosyltransferase involved in cell wall biosynthesis
MKVSVVVPVYNSSLTLERALRSLQLQTHQDWQAIVIDDGSKDNPREVIEKIGDPRIQFEALGKNCGRGVARQKGLDIASGQYLAMIDADDWIMPTKLEEQLTSFAQNEDVSMVSSAMMMVDDEDKLVGVERWGTDTNDRKYDPLKCLRPVPFAHGPTMIRMEVAKQYSYDKSLVASEDQDFLLQIMLEHKAVVLKKSLYCYRFQSGKELSELLQRFRNRKRIYRKRMAAFPWAARRNIFKSDLQSLIYRLSFAMGLQEKIFQSKMSSVNPTEAEEFSSCIEKLKL